MHLCPILLYNLVTTTKKGGNQTQMQTNHIMKILGLQSVKLGNVEIDELGVYTLHIQSTKKSMKCPNCNARTTKIHDKRIQRVRDIGIYGHPTYLSVLKRRFRCGCGHKFTEKIPFIPKYHQITSRVSMQILRDLGEMISLKSVAKRNNVSVATVKRIQDKIYHTNKPPLPRVLSIDEFKGHTNGIKFHCDLVDGENRKLLDIIQDRKFESLKEYFSRYSNKERQAVEYFVCDMWRPYVEIAKMYFPNAKIIIDKFHYSRMVYWALDAARRRIQKSPEKKHKKLFFNCRHLLMKRGNKLNPEGKQKLETLFWYSEELLQAYMLKEWFVELMEISCPNKREETLDRWITLAKNCGVPEFERYAKSFVNWQEEIVNSFYYPYTNGCIEGMNNLIKTIKRVSFGYQNFKSFRTRILHIKH